ALNHQPATFVVFYGSIFGINDETHLGFFDMGLLSNIPDLFVLTPTCKEEFLAMLRWAEDQRRRPVVILVPGGAGRSDSKITILDDYSCTSYEIVRKGSRIALIGVGTFLPVMQQAAENLSVKGFNPMVINPREVSTLDTACLDSIKDFELVITAEDGIIDGGFGQKVASYFGDTDVKVINLGLPKEFLNRYNAVELQRECNLNPDGITDIAMSALK
ncbi:MAG: 1-deoxy-D-xylulose-5-phosphate synthase, partial [Prevotella sp.]|nr:1-deoxy-D-xylulose-5-phosphate synthase [Prevotella sp.]